MTNLPSGKYVAVIESVTERFSEKGRSLLTQYKIIGQDARVMGKPSLLIGTREDMKRRKRRP